MQFKKEYSQIVAGMHNMIDMRAEDNVLFKCNNIFFGKTFEVFYLYVRWNPNFRVLIDRFNNHQYT
jgi:hypothetical protein